MVPIAQGAPLRVLALGDSITLGYNDPTGNSYRRDLACLLWTGGNPVSMTGSVRHGDWENNEVDAWVYHTTDMLRDRAAPELFAAGARPNVVVLHAGTVNFVLAQNVTEAPARLGALVDVVAQHNPAALVVVARLAPYHNATVDALVAAYNDALPALVAARARAGRRVVLASMHGLTVDLLPDGVHPAGVASRIMALRFYEAIAEAGRQGLIVPAQGPFEDRGASSVPPSGRCADLSSG